MHPFGSWKCLPFVHFWSFTSFARWIIKAGEKRFVSYIAIAILGIKECRMVGRGTPIGNYNTEWASTVPGVACTDLSVFCNILVPCCHFGRWGVNAAKYTAQQCCQVWYAAEKILSKYWCAVFTYLSAFKKRYWKYMRSLHEFEQFVVCAVGLNRRETFECFHGAAWMDEFVGNACEGIGASGYKRFKARLQKVWKDFLWGEEVECERQSVFWSFSRAWKEEGYVISQNKFPVKTCLAHALEVMKCMPVKHSKRRVGRYYSRKPYLIFYIFDFENLLTEKLQNNNWRNWV